MTGTVHVVGGGVAGLSAAIACGDAGMQAIVYEAGPQPGGRCRSYYDRELGCRVDNGNHLLLSGNRAAFWLLDRIGARDTMDGPGRPLFPFLDLSTGERWTLRPSAGRLPFWILDPRRRVPGTRARDYLALLKLRRPVPDATVAGLLRPDTLYRRLIEPLAVAALNTRPEAGAATLMATVVNETLARGGAACIPSFPRQGWSESLIDPAVATIRAQGGELHTGRKVTALRMEGGRAAVLDTADGPVVLGRHDAVVLAVPPWIAPALLPGLPAPSAFEAILNVHFAVEVERGEAGFTGLIGGTAEWVFNKPGHVSVTISAANRLVDEAADRIAGLVWPEVCRTLALSGPMPPWRVVKEKRATFAATPAQDRLRPGSRTGCPNLAVAGDWTATNLPATIEGAIRSGRTAAGIVAAGATRSG